MRSRLLDQRVVPADPAVPRRGRPGARALRETSGAGKIGTTGKGIGPAYEDKVARRALRVQDLKHPERFADEAARAARAAQLRARRLAPARSRSTFQPIFDDGDAGRRAAAADDRPTSATRSTTRTSAARNILFEGAQGTLLDIDHGTYPYVTSSNCVAGNAAAGAGVGPDACCTTSSASPRPTRRASAAARSRPSCRSTSPARSATTCRPSARSAARSPGGRAAAAGSTRRLLKRSIIINGISGLCITKLDVLDGLAEIKVCVGYELRGERIDILPLDADDIVACVPIYETLPGWSESTVGVHAMGRACRPTRAATSSACEAFIGAPIDMVSTGPDREHTILLRHPYQPEQRWRSAASPL